MRSLASGSAALVLLASAAACVGQQPPPPVLTITSPQRALIQDGGTVVVTGVAKPNADGDAVSWVTVNGTRTTVAPDGSFTATITLHDGASIIETIASTEYGGTASDARAVQIGHRLPVGSNIDHAVTAALSTDAFARLSTAAGPAIKAMNLPALLAPMQPLASYGDGIANVKLSITQLALSDLKISLQPVDGGLDFSAEIDGLDAAATAVYAGALVPDGTTTVSVATDKITLAGKIVVTPNGNAGFTLSIATPTVQTAALHLNANGLTGQVLALVNNNLGSTVQSIATAAAARGLEPLMNDALGALGGPQQLNVLGQAVTLEATPAAVAFTSTGAVVTMSLQTKIAGSEQSPGFIPTPNGTPALDPTAGIQLGLADDLVNELIAEIHARGLLDLHVDKDFGIFDALDISTAMPPMVSADNPDGTVRLVLGDLVAKLTNHGQPVVSAALNAQVDLKIAQGTNPNQMAIQFGDVHLWVNVIDDPSQPDGGSEIDVSGAAAAGIDLQLNSLTQFLITVPIPAVAGVQLDSLAMHADSGYIMVRGDIH